VRCRWHLLLTFVLLVCRCADGVAVVPAMHMETWAHTPGSQSKLAAILQ
jgi:hypothetical protein